MSCSKSLNLKVKIDPRCPNKEPICSPAKPGDTGLDIRIWVDNKKGEVNIPPHTMMDITTGASIALPKGYWGSIKSRSSTFAKRHLFVMDGIIDEAYRGTLSVYVWNPNDQGHLVKTGDRLAQLIILPRTVPKIKIVKKLSKTKRNKTGFGSTG